MDANGAAIEQHLADTAREKRGPVLHLPTAVGDDVTDVLRYIHYAQAKMHQGASQMRRQKAALAILLLAGVVAFGLIASWLLGVL